MKGITPKQLAKTLRNIGPISAKKLIEAGIDSLEKLQYLGAKEAYLRIYKSGTLKGKFHAIYLYALEGAILNCDWRRIPEKNKYEFIEFTKMLRKKHIEEKKKGKGI